MAADPDSSGAEGVTTRTMTQGEYEVWRERAIAGRAPMLAEAAGCSIAEALEFARSDLAQLLPAGLGSEGMWLLAVLDASGRQVGVLWIGPHPEGRPGAYIYDMEIEASHRGLGLGRAAMVEAESIVVGSGFDRISLNVLGPNMTAKRLYDSLDYQVVATRMTKSLSTSGRSG
jgi:ribosomal protein S18 acetylase RimI-like enzyme